MSSMTREQVDLLMRLQAVEFAAIDLNLFLDTHPSDERALADYNRLTDELHELIEEYRRRFGPLVNFGHGSSPGTWRWIDEPWPWEVTH